jgi:hypothetical protein
MPALISFLNQLDPSGKLYYLLVGAVVWLVIYLFRRFLPTVWTTITRKIPVVEQLPALVIAALISLKPALGMPLVQAVIHEITGAVLGALSAVGLHYTLRNLPGPYQGVVKTTDDGEKTPLDRPPPSGPNK